MTFKERVKNILIAWDQLIYVHITLGAGDPDETMSSAAYRAERNGKLFGRLFRPIIDFLFSGLEHNHCRNAYQNELKSKGFWKLKKESI